MNMHIYRDASVMGGRGDQWVFSTKSNLEWVCGALCVARALCFVGGVWGVCGVCVISCLLWGA